MVAFPFLIIGFFSLFAFLEGDTRREFSMPGICEDGKEYSAEGNKPSKKAVEVKDIHGRYNTDYDIEWTSDSSFTVEWEVWDEEHFADVEIEGRTYTIVAEG